MNALEELRKSAAQTTRIANMILSNPNTDPAEFAEAFRARDIASVEAHGYSEEQLAEMRWETGCGCNGDDSPLHTYFGFPSRSDEESSWDGLGYNEAELDHLLEEYTAEEISIIRGK